MSERFGQRVKDGLRPVVPRSLWDAGRVALGRASVAPPQGGVRAEPVPQYEALYEAHAQALPSESSIGDGDFELVGRVELSVDRLMVLGQSVLVLEAATPT